MTAETVLLESLIAVIVMGLLGGLLARWLKQPLILGYIFAGILFGVIERCGVHALGDPRFMILVNNSLTTLANVGVALLLFSMGLEFEKKDLKPIWNVAVFGTLGQVLFTLFAGTGIAWGITRFTDIPLGSVSSMLVFGAAFVSTSTAVVLKTLTSRGRMGTLSSKVMIGMSIVQDLTVIPIFLIVSKMGNLKDGVPSALAPLVLLVVCIVLLMTVGGKLFPLCLNAVGRTGLQELYLLAAVGIALLSGLFADWFQVSFSFGAFLAGIALSSADDGRKAVSSMAPVRDLFAMLFFVSIGTMLDVDFLLGHWLVILGVMFATSLSRTVFLAIVTGLNGFRNVIPFAMFFGMFPTSEIAFVLIQLARTDGLFSDEICSLVLAAVICSMLLGPLFDGLTSPVYRFYIRFRDRIGKKFTPQSDKTFVRQCSDHVVIAGGEKIGLYIAEQLEEEQVPYIIISSMRVEVPVREGELSPLIIGDPQQESMLKAAGIERARILLAAANDFSDNIAVIRAANRLRPGINVVTRVGTEEDARKLRNIPGLNLYDFVQPKFEAALEMVRQVFLLESKPMTEVQNYMERIRDTHYRPLYKELGLDRMPGGYHTFAGIIRMMWADIESGSGLAGVSIAESQIRSRTGASVVGVKRGSLALVTNPRPQFVLNAGDTVAVIGTDEQCTAFRKLCGPSSGDGKDADAGLSQT